MQETNEGLAAVAAESGEERLSKQNLWAFSLGGIGRDMAYGLFNNFLLTYILFTKSLTDPQFAVINVIIVAARIFDALNDPVMGGVVESTRTKWGKFKPWIVAGVLSCSAVIFLAFSSGFDGWNFIIFLGIIYFLFSITFTMNDISYWGMLPSLAKHPEDRDRLTSLAVLCAGVGGAVIGLAVPMFTAGNLTIGGNAISAYRIVALVTVLIFSVCQILTAVFVREKPLPPVDPSAPRNGLKRMLKVLFKNDQALWLALVFLLYNIGNNVLGGMLTTYVYFDFGYNGALLPFFSILSGAAGMLINLFYPKISKRFSRNALMRVSVISIAAGYLAMMLAGILLPKDPWLLKYSIMVVANFFVGFGQGFFYLILFISVANTVEYNEWKTGSRDEGLIFSMRPLMAKMGSAGMQLVVMLVYLAVGITTVTNQIADYEQAANLNEITSEQKNALIETLLNGVPSGKVKALLICMTVIPAVLITIGYLIYRSKFKIDEAFYARMQADIAARKAEKAAAKMPVRLKEYP